MDCVMVTSTQQGFFTQPPLSPGTPSNTEIEYFRIDLYSSYTAANYNDLLFSGIITRNGNATPIFGQPVHLPQYAIGDSLHGTYVLGMLDTLEIDGHLFHNVWEMKIRYTEQLQPYFTHDTYLYYQDSIGLIRHVTDMGNGSMDVWSLNRWNINL